MWRAAGGRKHAGKTCHLDRQGPSSIAVPSLAWRRQDQLRRRSGLEYWTEPGKMPRHAHPLAIAPLAQEALMRPARTPAAPRDSDSASAMPASASSHAANALRAPTAAFWPGAGCQSPWGRTRLSSRAGETLQASRLSSRPRCRRTRGASGPRHSALSGPRRGRAAADRILCAPPDP